MYVLPIFFNLLAAIGNAANLQDQRLKAYNRHDAARLTRIQADDFQIVFGNGRIEATADHLGSAPVTPIPGFADRAADRL